jgi:hypothetical protein
VKPSTTSPEDLYLGAFFYLASLQKQKDLVWRGLVKNPDSVKIQG